MKVMCGKYRPDRKSHGDQKRGQHDYEKKSKRQKVETVEVKPEINQVRQDSDSSDD